MNSSAHFWIESLTYDFSWRSVVKYLSKFDIRISSVFIRLILPVFFLRLFLVPRMFNINGKSRNWMTVTEKYNWSWKCGLGCKKTPILLTKFLFHKILQFSFLADWRTICLKFFKMFTKMIAKELRVRARFKFLNEFGHWSSF